MGTEDALQSGSVADVATDGHFTPGFAGNLTGKMGTRPTLIVKWLRVLATTERTQVNQRIRHQLHPVVSLLNTFKAEQQPLELVLPGKGPLDPQA